MTTIYNSNNSNEHQRKKQKNKRSKYIPKHSQHIKQILQKLETGISTFHNILYHAQTEIKIIDVECVWFFLKHEATTQKCSKNIPPKLPLSSQKKNLALSPPSPLSGFVELCLTKKLDKNAPPPEIHRNEIPSFSRRNVARRNPKLRPQGGQISLDIRQDPQELRLAMAIWKQGMATGQKDGWINW